PPAQYRVAQRSVCPAALAGSTDHAPRASAGRWFDTRRFWLRKEGLRESVWVGGGGGGGSALDPAAVRGVGAFRPPCCLRRVTAPAIVRAATRRRQQGWCSEARRDERIPFDVPTHLTHTRS